MARNDLWWWSATRVEIDQRSREARLRLEHAEGLLRLRMLPTRVVGQADPLSAQAAFFSRRTHAGPIGKDRSDPDD